MTRYSNQAAVGELGIVAMRRLCAEARQILREVVHHDVGIDGYLEPVEDGAATGRLIGVQMKSGRSRLSADGTRFTFDGEDADHWAYWAQCSVPVLGVVHVEGVGTWWLNVTALATDERIVSGPYSVTLPVSATTALSASQLVERVIPELLQTEVGRTDIVETRRLVSRAHKNVDASAPVTPVEELGSLLDLAFGLTSTDAERAQALYLLERFPRRADGPINAKLRSIGDTQIVWAIRAVHHMLNEGADTEGEYIAGLLGDAPDFASRLDRLITDCRVPLECCDAAVQVVEFIGDRERPDLWEFLTAQRQKP